MTKLERTGSSVESVIAAFRKEYDIKDWELKYEIIHKPRAGFLGLFARKTAVLGFELPGIEDRIRLFFEMMLAKMGIAYDSIKSKKEGKSIYLEVMGCKDPGFLIGKNGAMLKTLQYYLNRVFEGDRRQDAIYVDTEGYQEKQDAAFLRPFINQIAKVSQSGKSLTMEPMDSAGRRIIHRYVSSQPGLRTLTVGEGDKKRIVVMPNNQAEKQMPPKPRTKNNSGMRRPRQDDAPKADFKRDEHKNKAYPAPKTKAQATPPVSKPAKPKQQPLTSQATSGKMRRAPQAHTPKKTGKSG